MISYKNINVNLLSSKNISDLIIRKHNNNYIIGLITESSPFLHKRKRFRSGGIFCEEIFGFLYKCVNDKCKIIPEFNSNPILNKICLNCTKYMVINFKRKHRFGSIFLHFPILNYHYFKDFINLLKIFTKIKKNYFYENKLFKIGKEGFLKNNFFYSMILENKFLNFINLFYKTISFIELFKLKLNFINKHKFVLNNKLNKFSKLSNEFSLLKKLFLTLFPILPAGLRVYSLDNRKLTVNSRFNSIYNALIDLNNSLIDYNNGFENYNLKNVLVLHFLITVILDFSKPQNVFGQINDLYNKLHGKYGVFRQNLLGFRVDYSGRAVIVPGPSQPLNNIGLPIDMIYHYVRYDNTDDNYTVYKPDMYKHCILSKIDFFTEYLNDYSVIANRAPTLHKMNIQSFNPILIEGDSIKLMPLLCAGYNADFDGDQMGIFSLLKECSLVESYYMLKPLVNIHSPTTKNNIFNLTQGMLGGYYTLSNYNYLKFIDSYIASDYNDFIEYSNKNILINTPVLLRHNNLFYYTTCGRLLLNCLI